MAYLGGFGSGSPGRLQSNCQLGLQPSAASPGAGASSSELTCWQASAPHWLLARDLSSSPHRHLHGAAHNTAAGFPPNKRFKRNIRPGTKMEIRIYNFHDLILEMTYYLLCHTSLAAQTEPETVEEGVSQGLGRRGRIMGAILQADFHRWRTGDKKYFSTISKTPVKIW